MAEVLLFHHVQGRTAGVVAFADELRAARHVVHTPDLFGGRILATLEEGMAYVDQVGFDDLVDRGLRCADGLSDALSTPPGRSSRTLSNRRGRVVRVPGRRPSLR